MKSLALGLLVLLAVVQATLPALAAGLTVQSAGLALLRRDYGDAVTCTLSAAADTYVGSDQSGTSFGGAASLLVDNSSSSTRRALLRFDLGGCAPAIPVDAIVHEATLHLTTSSLLNVGPRTYGLRRATAAWSESTSWSAQPPTAGSLTSSATIGLAVVVGTPIDWPVASDVQSFVSNQATNHGWQLADTVEGVTPLLAASISFASREASSGQPRLTITYAP